MSEEKEVKCGNCYFFDPRHPDVDDTGFVGFCRRHPTTETKQIEDWCGEFKPKGEYQLGGKA